MKSLPIVLVLLLIFSLNALTYWNDTALLPTSLMQFSEWKSWKRPGSITPVNISMKSETPHRKQQQVAVISSTTSAPQTYIERTTNQTLPIKQTFLFPLQRYGCGGHNTQYSNFLNAIMMAYLTNRTIVLAPFFTLGSSMRPALRGRPKLFNAVFDGTRLGELLPVASVEQFKERCDGNITVIAWTQAGYQETLVKVNRAYHIAFPKANNIISLENIRDVMQLENMIGQNPCLVYYRPHEYRFEGFPVNMHRFLIRSEVIRNTTTNIIQNLFQGKPYLGLHWRNKTTEYKCAYNLPNHRGERSLFYNSSCKDKIDQIALMADKASEDIEDMMKTLKVDRIYVSCPSWSRQIINHLAKRIPRDHILTSADIPTKKEGYQMDPYELSLVEQEICFRSDHFIASCKSHWSKLLMAERSAVNLNWTCTSDLPGLSSLGIEDYIIKLTRKKK